MAARLLVAAAVAHVALAYSNTSPLVAWSTSGSSSLQNLPSKFDTATDSLSLIESILSGEDVCSHDAVILVAQPGLHSSDLRTLQPQTQLSQTLASAPAVRQYPYIPSYAALDVAKIGDQLAAKCNSRMVSYSAGTTDQQLHRGKKHVLCMSMPDLNESGRERKEAMRAHESLLSSELSNLASTFPNHLVIYTGSYPSSHGHLKRQAGLSPDRPILDLSTEDDYDYDYDFEDYSTDELPSTSAPKLTFSAPSNTTLPQGGILKRFQILTPALITGLLVSFFLLVPVLYLALSTLASIQIPVRSDVGKTFNAVERKNQ